MLEGAASEMTDRSRLSCQIKLTARWTGLVVHLPEDHEPAARHRHRRGGAGRSAGRGQPAPAGLYRSHHADRRRAGLPYQRPPLSKAYLRPERPRPALRPQSFFDAKDITYLPETVVGIDRPARQVVVQARRAQRCPTTI